MQQVEKTAKRYKVRKLVGGLMIVAGTVLLIVGANGASTGAFDDGPATAMELIGFLMLIVGLLVVVVTSIAVWWNHG